MEKHEVDCHNHPSPVTSVTLAPPDAGHSMLEPTDPGAMAAIGRLGKMETIVQKSLAAAALVAMTITPPLIPAALAADDAPVAVVETEFTPLDEIDRVRKSGCGIDDFEEFLSWYVSSTKSG